MDGPVRATILLEGTLPGHANRCRFQARVSFFAGLPLVKMVVTIHNPGRARHRGGLWDLGDRGSFLFRDLSIHLVPVDGVLGRVSWIEDVDSFVKHTLPGRFEIYQESSGGENWRSPNHSDRRGHVPARFRGYRVQHDGIASYSLRASPVVSVCASGLTMTVGIPEFWQQFPKAIGVDDSRLTLQLFPEGPKRLHELQGGEQKTHTVWLHFGPEATSGVDSLAWIHQPARVHCSAEWHAESRAIPQVPLAVASEALDRFTAYAKTLAVGPNSLQSRREVIDEYGWRNYGEIYADHENEYFTGRKPVVSHYNNQYDLVFGAFLQYLFSEDRAWFDLGDALARHVMDIDVYRTDRDKAAYSGGLFWHTDHYRDAATATHRCYSGRNRGASGRDYGGGPSNEHNYTTGLMYYYYLTGDDRARETVLCLANWVIGMDDGRRTIFGLIDPGPTGLASSTADPNYHGPGRGCANSVNALLDAWLLSSDRCYLDKAEQLIRRAVHPATDIGSLDLLDVERRWSYTVFLTLLARYLQLKQEHGEEDRMYDYARASLVRFAGWMAENEVPYFDRPEKLDYPTEAWAAHELRKGNVLRLAAAFVDEPHRRKWVQRGNELAERAWSDLLQFDSRFSARAAAIVLQEGLRDLLLRCSNVVTKPEAEIGMDHGLPEEFVAQKRRVLGRLKSARGMIVAVRSLTSIGNWRAFLAARRRARPRAALVGSDRS